MFGAQVQISAWLVLIPDAEARLLLPPIALLQATILAMCVQLNITGVFQITPVYKLLIPHAQT